jgi:hypothetical protein
MATKKIKTQFTNTSGQRVTVYTDGTKKYGSVKTPAPAPTPVSKPKTMAESKTLSTPVETVANKYDPEESALRINNFNSALNVAIDQARQQRKDKTLDFLGGIIPKGALPATSFAGVLSAFNSSSAPLEGSLISSASNFAQQQEQNKYDMEVARQEQVERSRQSIRDLALSVLEAGASAEVISGITNAKDLDSAMAMASGAMNAKGKMKTEQIGTKLVQYDPNDPEGTVRVLFDGGSGSGDSGKAEKPSIVTISPEKKQSLVSAGFNAQEIDTIESDVSEFGLQAVLDGLENEEEKQAVRAVYNKSASKENEVFLNEDYFKSLFGEEELKKVAKEAGLVTGGDDFIPFNESGDVEAYLKQLMSTVELYRQAGYSDKEILTKMQ